jgi:hypothetical protein
VAVSFRSGKDTNDAVDAGLPLVDLMLMAVGSGTVASRGLVEGKTRRLLRLKSDHRRPAKMPESLVGKEEEMIIQVS